MLFILSSRSFMLLLSDLFTSLVALLFWGFSSKLWMLSNRFADLFYWETALGGLKSYFIDKFLVDFFWRKALLGGLCLGTLLFEWKLESGAIMPSLGGVPLDLSLKSFMGESSLGCLIFFSVFLSAAYCRCTSIYFLFCRNLFSAWPYLNYFIFL